GVPTMSQQSAVDERAIQAETGAEIQRQDHDHVFHTWAAQAHIKPLAIAGGQGSVFWDYDGKRYLDFSSQLINLNLGHQHPKMIAAIKAQADRLTNVAPPFANDMRSEAARLIA